MNHSVRVSAQNGNPTPISFGPYEEGDYIRGVFVEGGAANPCIGSVELWAAMFSRPAVAGDFAAGLPSFSLLNANPRPGLVLFTTPLHTFWPMNHIVAGNFRFLGIDGVSASDFHVLLVDCIPRCVMEGLCGKRYWERE